MGILLGIVSGKGGTGKSTVALGLGAAFANLNKSVLLVDLDEGLRCLDLMAGIEDEVVYDLSDVLSGGDPDAASYKSAFYENLKIIPAPLTAGSVNYVNLSAFCERIKNRYDAVIFDFPAGVDFGGFAALGKDIQFIAVTNMDPVSTRDAAVLPELLPDAKNAPRLIINKFDVRYIKDGLYGNVDSAIDRTGMRLLGLVPISADLLTLPLSHKLSKKSRAYAALLRIAKRLSGDDVPLPRPDSI